MIFGFVMFVSTMAADSRTKQQINVEFVVDSAVVSENAISATASFKNKSVYDVIIFPPEYGLFMGVITASFSNGKKTFNPRMRTDIDYDAYKGITLKPNEERAFKLTFARFEMYDTEEGRTPYTLISKERFRELIASIKTMTMKYNAIFDSTITVHQGKEVRIEKHPCFGKYTEMRLSDSVEIRRNRWEDNPR